MTSYYPHRLAAYNGKNNQKSYGVVPFESVQRSRTFPEPLVVFGSSSSCRKGKLSVRSAVILRVVVLASHHQRNECLVDKSKAPQQNKAFTRNNVWQPTAVQQNVYTIIHTPGIAAADRNPKYKECVIVVNMGRKTYKK